MDYFDQWLWLILMIAGLLLAVLELVVAGTELDLVFIGSSFFLGGLVTWPFHSWELTTIVVSVLCVVYVAIGRKYVHKWVATKNEKTNIDTIIGRQGIVLKATGRNVSGLVKIGNEEWRAISEEEIKEGGEIQVVEIKGVTLTVKRI